MTFSTRRSLLRSIPVALAATAGCAAPTRDTRGTATDRDGAQGEAGWPMFRADARNTGCRPDAHGPRDPSPAWSYETGADVWGSPVVADGVVYVGSHDANLYALDAGTGDPIWRFGTGGRIEGSPAVVGDTVYVGSTDRNVYAVDARAGTERWRYETTGLIRGSPTVDGEALYIGGNCRHLECEFYGGTETPTPAGESGGHVFALDRDTGDPRWQYETGDGVVSTPAVGGGVVYVGSSDGNVYAIDAGTGERIWSHGTDDWVFASPTLDGETVYVPSMDGTVYAIDAETGEPRWTFETRARYISGSTAVCDGTVYFGVPAPPRLSDFDDLARVYALSADTGEERWSFRTDVLEIGSSPAVTGEALYIGCHNILIEVSTFPKVYALGLDGEELWHFNVRGEGVGSSPAVVDGTLYFGDSKGNVYALE